MPAWSSSTDISSGALDQSTMTSAASDFGTDVSDGAADVLPASASEVFGFISLILLAEAFALLVVFASDLLSVLLVASLSNLFSVSLLVSLSSLVSDTFTDASTGLYSGIFPAGTQILPLFPTIVTWMRPFTTETFSPVRVPTYSSAFPAGRSMEAALSSLFTVTITRTPSRSRANAYWRLVSISSA